MLGRLARWLRLIGQDTLYYSSIEDSRLLRIAREENRTVLTRDTRLVKVRDLKDVFLVTENDPLQQVKEVITTFNLLPQGGTGSAGLEGLPSGRCSLCNAALEDIPPEQARAFVPDYVYRTSSAFKRCPSCGKFYWQGTHTEKLRKKLHEILYN